MLKTNKEIKAMKMTVEHSKKTTEVVEIELPYFSKSEVAFYKVVDEKTAVRVSEMMGDNWIGVEIQPPSLAFGDSVLPCTEEDFNDAYKRIMNRVNNIAIKKK